MKLIKLFIFILVLASASIFAQPTKFKPHKHILWQQEVVFDVAFNQYQYTTMAYEFGDRLSVLKQKESEPQDWSNYDATLSKRLVQDGFLFNKKSTLFASSDLKKVLKKEDILSKLVVPKVINKGKNLVIDSSRVDASDIFCYRFKGILYYNRETKSIDIHPEALGVVVNVPVSIDSIEIMGKYDTDVKFEKQVLFWIPVHKANQSSSINDYDIICRTSKKVKVIRTEEQAEDEKKWLTSVSELLNTGCDIKQKVSRKIYTADAHINCTKSDSLASVLDSGVYQYNYNYELYKSKCRLSNNLQIHTEWKWKDSGVMLELSTYGLTIYMDDLDDNNAASGREFVLLNIIFE